VDGTQAACGTCHGFPPPTPHPGNSNCNLCHPDTVNDSNEIDISSGKHVNGTVELMGMNCNSCHGSEDNAAPPVSTKGSSDTGDTEVGAHQSHVRDGDLRMALACDNCHIVPQDINDPGHLDDPPAEITWGDLAKTGGLAPEWDRNDDKCSNAYCHGATLSGGSITEPEWTKVDGTQSVCGACHGFPPPDPHPENNICWPCHPDTVDRANEIDISSGKHVNGTVEVAGMNCNSCHGSEDNAAPPVSTTGSSDTGDTEVGAHQSHVRDGDLRMALACDNCHVVPADVNDPGHLDDPPAEITWGDLAKTGGLEPEWDRNENKCSNTYCHGVTLSGGNITEPEWTKVDGTQSACGTCHGIPPSRPHPGNPNCWMCHPETVDESNEIIVAAGRHVDGEIQVGSSDCGDCHGVPPATGGHAVHYAAGVDDAAYGGTGISGDLLPDGSDYAFDCGNCHPLDEEQHMNGVPNSGGGDAEIDLSPIGAPPSSLKAMNPETADYTPGGTLFEDPEGYQYTIGTCSNVYCHSILEFSTPAPVPEPGVDFPFTGYPIVYPPYTVDIVRTYSDVVWDDTLDCAGCHGFPPRTFCSEQAGECTEVDAAAGDSHNWIDGNDHENLHGFIHGIADPLACATCHFSSVTEQGTRSRDGNGWSVYETVPIDDHTQHVDGEPDVAFATDLIEFNPSGGPSFYDLSTASYEPSSKTCSNVSCHLQQTAVDWGQPYRYWNTPECNSCHQYDKAKRP